MTTQRKAARWLMAFGLLMSVSSSRAIEPLGTPDPASIAYPDGVAPDPRLIELGRSLFFDKRLSGNQSQSCASCHNPELGLGDGLPRGHGSTGQQLPRNTPPLYNLAWNVVFFWDGRAHSLEEQALVPMRTPTEMNLSPKQLLARLKAAPSYRQQFHALFGKTSPTAEQVCQALAAFERTLISRHSAFDRYLAGDHSALSESAQRGLALFEGKGQCTICHDGPNLTDNSFHNIGLKSEGENNADPGRAAIVGDNALLGAFKTPGLRNVALTAPYMHDGSLATLEAVVQHYNRGGEPVPNRDPLIRPLHLNDQEVQDLVAFLQSLTDPVALTAPRLP